MASGSNGHTWFGNLCYQFNVSETDVMLIEEPMKYLSEKLTVAGDSFLQFCSDISDVLPTSIFSSEEEETAVANVDFPVSDHSSESVEKVTDMTWSEFISRYKSLVDKTVHSPVVDVIVSNDAREAVKNSEQTVNNDEQDEDQTEFSDSEYSSERAEKGSDTIALEELFNKLDEIILSGGARSTEAFWSSGSSFVNNELEPPNAVEPDQFLSDSAYDYMDYELEPAKKLEPDDLMELSDVLNAYASIDEVLDYDVIEEDNEVTVPSYIEKIEESLIVVAADESQQETFQPTNKKLFQKRSLKRTDAESDQLNEDFSDIDCDWEFSDIDCDWEFV